MIQSKILHNEMIVKKYNDDYYKVILFRTKKRSGFEEEKKEIHYIAENKNSDDSIISSIYRSRRKVFEYAVCNEFEYFITLTLNDEKYNRYDLDKYIKDLGAMINNINNYHKCDVKYILIPEKHIDGAWHMHGLIKGIPKKQLEVNKHGYSEWINYTRRFGFMSMSKIRNNIAVSKYIIKYITKDIDIVGKYKKRYFCSMGLKKAKNIISVEYMPEWGVKFDWSNEFVKIKEMNKEEYINLTNKMK